MTSKPSYICIAFIITAMIADCISLDHAMYFELSSEMEALDF
jgi:hypothetical protein